VIARPSASSLDDRLQPTLVYAGHAMSVRLLTTEKVAARFRTSPATVRYWRHVGIGPAGVRVGRRVLYEEAECDRWWQDKVASALNTPR
jgi:hypothetical protein